MAEMEERPSKIRKIDPPAGPNESIQSDTAAPEVPRMVFSESTSDQLEDEGQAPSYDGHGEGEDEPKLSKSQLKKLKKKEQWEAGREYRKVKRREKHHEKQARKKEQREELQAKVASGENMKTVKNQDEEKPKYPRRPIQMPVSLILDCDFNELMFEKELISFGAQLTRCYSENRKNPYRSHLALSSWGGTLKSRFETVLTNNHLSWKGVKFFADDFVVAAETLDEVMRSTDGGTLAGAFVNDTVEAREMTPDLRRSTIPRDSPEGSKEISMAAEAVILKLKRAPRGPNGVTPTTKTVFTIDPAVKTDSESEQENPSLKTEDAPPEKSDPSFEKATPSIVYLTADSPHTLERLSPNTCYIIGGIVDKNRHKGLCYKRACERGIPTAKLPIGKYMTMQSRSVLAVNHVVEIMLKWLVTGDWGEAFLSVIPKRKEAKLKVKRKNHSDGEEEESEDEEEGGTSLLETHTTETGTGGVKEGNQRKELDAIS